VPLETKKPVEPDAGISLNFLNLGSAKYLPVLFTLFGVLIGAEGDHLNEFANDLLRSLDRWIDALVWQFLHFMVCSAIPQLRHERIYSAAI
jgi:hypothetical protein